MREVYDITRVTHVLWLKAKGRGGNTRNLLRRKGPFQHYVDEKKATQRIVAHLLRKIWPREGTTTTTWQDVPSRALSSEIVKL